MDGRRLTPRDECAVIVVTRRNGAAFALNPDLIERAEATPDTVVTLVGGNRYVLVESLAELVERIRAYRASVVAMAEQLSVPGPAQPPVLRVVPATGPEA
jgi:flagellar protein FlbD